MPDALRCGRLKHLPAADQGGDIRLAVVVAGAVGLHDDAVLRAKEQVAARIHQAGGVLADEAAPGAGRGIGDQAMAVTRRAARDSDEDAAVLVPLSYIVHGAAILAATSCRHSGLIVRVMAASSSCSAVLVIACEIGMMPSTVAISRSPPIGRCAFMPMRRTDLVAALLPPVGCRRRVAAGEDNQLALIGAEDALVVDAVASVDRPGRAKQQVAAFGRRPRQRDHLQCALHGIERQVPGVHAAASMKNHRLRYFQTQVRFLPCNNGRSYRTGDLAGIENVVQVVPLYCSGKSPASLTAMR